MIKVRLLISHVGITHVAIRFYKKRTLCCRSIDRDGDLRQLILHAILLGNTDGFGEVGSSNFGMRACMYVAATASFTVVS